ncbi:Cytoglobin-1 [Fragariocoptes setiger]|uniref:Cytoglobin-1 n=1 Tax=Fragariocoptes setiger TaxID=1670756 RepID=A0ABQ7SDB9_9ACAR|nr:Cytoglobin-1 [Fragariocoptes setiger]
MALTENEVELIKSSWKPAEDDPKKYAVLLFKMLFTKYPEYPKLFSDFSDVDVANIESDKRVLRHALKVLNAITGVVHLLGDPEKMNDIVETLEQMARGHLRRQIGLDKFENLGHVLIEFICQVNDFKCPASVTVPESTDSTAPNKTTNGGADDNAQQTAASIDASDLVKSWTKLYSVILDIVKKESASTPSKLIDLPTASSMDDDI